MDFPPREICPVPDGVFFWCLFSARDQPTVVLRPMHCSAKVAQAAAARPPRQAGSNVYLQYRYLPPAIVIQTQTGFTLKATTPTESTLSISAARCG
jgi:hypothetical protein